MIPSSEPNSLPPLFSDPQDWRDTYTAYANEFKDSPKAYSDEVLLEIKLKRLGFIGVRLDAEIRYIKENCR